MRLTLPRVSTTLLRNELHILSRFKTLWFAYYGGTGKIWTRDQAVMSRQLWPAELLSHIAGNKPALFIIFVNLHIHRSRRCTNKCKCSPQPINLCIRTDCIGSARMCNTSFDIPINLCIHTDCIAGEGAASVPAKTHQSVHTHRLYPEPAWKD